MKAIRTRYIGPTNTRGSRIKASDGDGNTYSMPYPQTMDSDDAHEMAAYGLMAKMGWPNVLNGGGFDRDMYWTMIPIVQGGLEPAYVAYFKSEKVIKELRG